MVVSLITKGIDIFFDHKKNKAVIDAARDRVVDEVKINLSVLDKYLASERKDANSEESRTMKRKAALSLSTSALEKVSSGDIPFSAIFPEKLVHPSATKTSKEGKLRQYHRWIENDQTAADLLRRVRIRFATMQRLVNDGEDPGDLGYLRFQLRAFLKSQAKPK